MNGTSRTSSKKKSKQQRRNGNCVNTGKSVTSTLSKKQQAIFNDPVKLGDEVLVTVSYTHLDVYKRQNGKRTNVILGPKNSLLYGAGTVSYTHLDVYKRQ